VTKRSFGAVVVPRHTIILDKWEQRFLISLKPLPVSGRDITDGCLSNDHISVKAVDPPAMFAETSRFKAEPLNVFENRNQQITNSRDKSLQFIVKWILPEIIVQVSDQMDEAFLLHARERVISSIEVRDDDAFESREKWL
jgi:hypothetical protein